MHSNKTHPKPQTSIAIPFCDSYYRHYGAKYCHETAYY
jgi:hypothetical protein